MEINDKKINLKKSTIVAMIIMSLLFIVFISLRFAPIIAYKEGEVRSQISLGIEYNIDIFVIVGMFTFEILFAFLRKKLFYILSLVFCLISALGCVFYGLIANFIIYYFLLILILYLINLILIIVTKENL